ncbi:hypothetical protein [Cellulosilyticum ruminicola]|uniref:hypothetical protein n=1 Tax=Cellulosilyticum ruminicola TaxID=425254 RepID=UPI0006D1EE4A|nr:hypothetical protein [Cellulosilyticum ruminicola]
MQFKSYRKRIILAIMAGSLLASYMPAMAQEMTWHKWATPILMDGEKYGIYSITWYDDMQTKMDGKTLQTYCEAIGKKIEAIHGVKMKENPDELAYGTDVVTRGEVLESIYKVLS